MVISSSLLFSGGPASLFHIAPTSHCSGRVVGSYTAYNIITASKNRLETPEKEEFKKKRKKRLFTHIYKLGVVRTVFPHLFLWGMQPTLRTLKMELEYYRGLEESPRDLPTNKGVSSSWSSLKTSWWVAIRWSLFVLGFISSLSLSSRFHFRRRFPPPFWLLGTNHDTESAGIRFILFLPSCAEKWWFSIFYFLAVPRYVLYTGTFIYFIDCWWFGGLVVAARRSHRRLGF